MITSVLIIAFSVLLLLYWFRYTCLLILSTKTTKDYTVSVATANRLGFLEAQDILREQLGSQQLNELKESLDRDYRLLTGLLRHAASFQIGGCSVEQRMLMVDYAAMRVWFRLSRRFSQSAARHAVEEMAGIVAHFANLMGERAAEGAR